MMSCSFGEVRAYRNAASVPGQFKRPLSPELWTGADRVVPSADIRLIMNPHGLGMLTGHVCDEKFDIRQALISAKVTLQLY